jgi:large subunit ribosomal protein L17
MTEKLITRAKKGGLANRRLIIARLNNMEIADFLVDVVAPQISRNSGYLKIEFAGYRKGDHAELGTISFVDDINPEFSKDAKSAEKAAPVKEEKAEAKVEKAAEPKKESK